MNNTKKAFLFVMLLISLIVVAACSSNIIKDVELVEIQYWEKDGKNKGNESLQDKDSIEIFVDAVNKSEKLKEQKIVKIQPLLTFSMELQNDEKKYYHLWINELGEGYIQRLIPDDNATFTLDAKTIEKLTDFIEQRRDVNLISSKIDFVQIGDFPSPRYIPEEGKITIYHIYDPEDLIEGDPIMFPDYLMEYINSPPNHTLKAAVQMTLENFNKEYPRMNITDAPYVIYVDHEGIFFQTSNMEEAERFHKENILN